MRFRPTIGTRRRAAAYLAVVAAMLTSLITLSAPSASAAVGCRVDYTVNDWGGGFTATVRINNLGDPVNGWTRYPRVPAIRRMRSAVSAFTRPGLEKARETVEGATPAAAATS